MEIKKNGVYELAIQGMTNEGSGVAKLEGYTVFVPETAVGDICRVKLLKCGKGYGFGKVEELLSPSPERISPDCAVYHSCGGCVYRHIHYQAELQIKETVVKDAFERLGGIRAPVKPILGSALQDGYRNKAQYPVGLGRDGRLVSGFYVRRSHRIVDCEACLLQPEIFGKIQRTVLELLEKYKIPIYDEASHGGLVRHIYLRRAEATGEIMVCLVSASRTVPHISELVGELSVRFPEIASIILNVNKCATNVILGAECRTLYGRNTISDILCDIQVELSPLSFYQVNHAQAEILYHKALEYASLQKSDTLLDLYCGAGTIGLAAAGRANRLLGVEIIPDAVENAKRNAQRNGIGNARFLCADAGSAAQMLLEEGMRPNVVIVDPPRKGLDAAVIEAIVQMGPGRLVMVSCNPATAARDVALLEKNGYQAMEITPVDMFPRTTHVEVVIMMTYCGSDKKDRG